MKRCSLLLVLINVGHVLFAQQVDHMDKPPIDISVFGNWPFVSEPFLTNDGNYFMYTIRNQPTGGQTKVIQQVKGAWKTELVNVGQALFTEDNKKVVFVKPYDTLCLLTLGTFQTAYIPDVRSFTLFRGMNEEWIAYESSGAKKQLFVKQLKDTGIMHSYEGVLDYLMDKDGRHLILKIQSQKDNIATEALLYINIINGSTRLISEEKHIEGIVLDQDNTSLACMAVNHAGEKYYRYYKFGTDYSIPLLNSQSPLLDSCFELGDIVRFSLDGSRLFFKLKKKDLIRPDPNTVQVDLWSYTDMKLQSQQLKELNDEEANAFMAVINVQDATFIRLQWEDEKLMLFENNYRDDIGIITENPGDENEANWNRAARPTFYLISTVTGKKTKLPINYPYELSPGGRYLVGSDAYMATVSNNLLAYDLKNGKVLNLTGSISIPTGEVEVVGKRSIKHRDLRIIRWIKDDKAVLVSDKFDVWRINLAGNIHPVNLTNYYGRKNKIVFRPCGLQDYYAEPVSEQETLLLSAFCLKNKHSGFYSMSLHKQADPALLTSGPYCYEHFFDLFAPLKARDANIYVVDRQTAERSMNYFWTDDFKAFHPLSEVYPETKYNWLTAELIYFKTVDERVEQGVLYKPQDFNPHRKYPMIMHYYQEMSNDLFKYKRPEAIYHNMNIPWFVSNGYVVFTPDIHYTLGKTGEAAYNSVVGAFNYFKQFSWFESKSVGLQGHSFGGYETNFIITHTHAFSAAMSSSSNCDLISDYGSIARGIGNQFMFETHQYRLGSTLWDKPDRYIANSPIFRVNKITTPLLMMNNKSDAGVPFSQGIEFFTALRRLGKRVWLLQYDNGSHTLSLEKDAVQHTIRITQFFDHYLKGKLPPRWLTRGIPASRKGIENGLDLEIENHAAGNRSTNN